MSMELYFSCVFFVLGLLSGSFYNVVGMRIPLNESIVFPNSHCPHCKTELKWYELFPVLSYLGLRGKCRTCKTHISMMYPIMELTTGILFLAAYMKFGLEIELLYYLVLLSMLIVLTISDLKTMLIPNKILLTFGILLVPFSFVVNEISYMNQFFGLALAFGINLLIILCTKGNGMGGGDMKLFMLLGLLFGVKVFITIFFTSVVVGLIIGLLMKIKTKSNVFPFGPSIAIATVLNIFFGNELIQIYVQTFF